MAIVGSDADTDRLVHDYLGRLHAAGWALPAERRDELVSEVGEHITEALRAEPDAGEVAVRNVLERLGPPEEIVRAETEGEPYAGAGAPRPAAYQSTSPWGGLEITAIVLLVIGGVVVPILGPFIGLALVWVSPRWTRREKVTGTVLGLLPLLVFLLVFARGPL